jgi:hypothetical protein
VRRRGGVALRDLRVFDGADDVAMRRWSVMLCWRAATLFASLVARRRGAYYPSALGTIGAENGLRKRTSQVAGAPHVPADPTCGERQRDARTAASSMRRPRRVENVAVGVMAVIVRRHGGARNAGNHGGFR